MADLQMALSEAVKLNRSIIVIMVEKAQDME